MEKYMSDEVCDIVTAYYTIQNGTAVLSSMVDRYMVDFPNKRRLNTALLYPSQYLKRYLEEMDEKVRSMLKQVGIENGTLFLEGCVDKEGFYLWEAGFRLCGAQQNIFPAYINHIDVQELLICHALTGKMADRDMTGLEDPWFRGKTACNGLLFITPGRIAEIRGVDVAKKLPGIVNFTPLVEIGATVTKNDVGTLNQTFARFHIVADNKEDLFQIMKSIQSTIAVLDENGRNMLLDTFDYNEMRQEKRWIK